MLVTSQTTSEKITETVEEQCGAICSTMSPNGSVVNISKSGIPFTTKDGTTVAQAIKYEDKAKDLIALQIAQATVRTDELCGDGTTTTAFLIREFYRRFNGKLDFRKRRLVERMCEFSIETIKKLTHEVKIDDTLLYDVLLTTSNNDHTIVDKVLEIYRQFTTYPKFILKSGLSEEDTYVINPSMEYRGGYADPRFSANGQGATEVLLNYRPLVYEGGMTGLRDTTRSKEFLEFFGIDGTSQIDNVPYVLIARDFDNETKDFIGAINSQLRFQKFILVTVTGAGTSAAALMKDIATVIGVPLRGGWFTIHKGEFQDLPALTVGTGTLSFKPISDTQKQRVEEAALAVSRTYEGLDVETKRSALGALIKSRYESLTGCSVTIHVGGVVDTEVSERKDRYEDVYKVARSALMSGIIKGCGQTLVDTAKLVRLAFANEKEQEIVETFALALEAQTRFLLGYDESTPPEEFKYVNLATGDVSDDAGALNIWDASLASQTALDAGLKTALLLMNTSYIILGNRLGSVKF